MSDRLPPATAQAALEALWLPFTHNRHFKQHPRMVSGAEGMYYTTPDGRRVLDGLSGPCGAATPAIAIRASSKRSRHNSMNSITR